MKRKKDEVVGTIEIEYRFVQVGFDFARSTEIQ